MSIQRQDSLEVIDRMLAYLSEGHTTLVKQMTDEYLDRRLEIMNRQDDLRDDGQGAVPLPKSAAPGLRQRLLSS